MQAKFLSLLVLVFLVLVVSVLYRAMRNALKGITRAARARRYLRGSAMQPGFEPDTVMGWLLAILSMLIAVAALTGLAAGILLRVWS